MQNHLVIVTINSNYRASVYDVEDLKRYVADNPRAINYRLLAVEETQRHQQENSVETKDGYAEHLQSVKDYVQELKESDNYPGRVVWVWRNQAKRIANILFFDKVKKVSIIYYTMPHGAFFMNELDDIYEPDEYSPVSMAQFLKRYNDEQKRLLLIVQEKSLDELDENARKWEERDAFRRTTNKIKEIKNSLDGQS